MGTRRLGMTALALLSLWCWGRSDAKSNRPEVEAVQEWTLARENAEGLRLRSRGGNIHVIGGAGDRLQIHAIKKARASSESDARAFLQQMQIERRRDGDQWVVEATWPAPRTRHLDSASVSFEVRVPRGMRLETQTGGGNLQVSGVGESRLRTGGGNVELRDAGGRVEVYTGGGNLQLVDCAGPIDLQTGGGNIEIRGATQLVKAHTGGGNIAVEGRSGPVDVHTGGGNISISQAESPVKANTGGGNIDVTVARSSGALQVELGTGAGDVALRLPESASARLVAETGQGQVHLEPDSGARFNQSRTRVEAVLGDGQGSVRLHTGSGGVHIRLASAR